MRQYLLLLGILLLTIGSGCAHTRHACPPLHCSSCGKTCQPEVKETESTHDCYSEACKDICIPAIRFPWQDCCAPLKCGKVRSVKVLKKYEYKCPDCEVKWNVVDSDCCSDCGGAGGCTAGGSASPSDTQPQPAEPTPAQEEKATEQAVAPVPPLPTPLPIALEGPQPVQISGTERQIR